MSYNWKQTDKESDIADKKAEEYAEELKKQQPSNSFGMGVDDDGY